MTSTPTDPADSGDQFLVIYNGLVTGPYTPGANGAQSLADAYQYLNNAVAVSRGITPPGAQVSVTMVQRVPKF